MVAVLKEKKNYPLLLVNFVFLKGPRPVKPPTSMPSGVLRYETLKQLQTYVDLQLRVQIIENQLQVEQVGLSLVY